MGPISYRETKDYARDLDLNSDAADFMWDVIHRLDTSFLKIVNEKAEAEAEIEKMKRKEGFGGRRGTPRH